MTREEFSKLLRQHRKESKTTLKTLCMALNVLSNGVYHVENGTHNYTLGRAITYANAVNCEIIAIAPNEEIHTLSSPESAVQLLISARGETTRYRVAKDVGMTQPGLVNVEKGNTNLTIDMLLKLLEYYGYIITVRPK